MSKTIIKMYQDTFNKVAITFNTFLLLLGIFVNLKNTFTMQTILEAKEQVEALFIIIGASGLTFQLKGYKKMMNYIDNESKEELEKDKEVQWFKKNGIKALIAIGVVECAYMYTVNMQLSDKMQAMMCVIGILMLTVVNTINTYVIGMLTAYKYE